MHTFITYSSINAPDDERWIAYINGWKVKFVGKTEDEAKAKATTLWEGERKRMSNQSPLDQDGGRNVETTPIITKEGRGHANTGKIWMHHNDHGFARVPLTEISLYEGRGYIRKGPRSK